MYNLKLNNYHSNPKLSTIYTHQEVSQFLFNLLQNKFCPEQSFIFDPCSGLDSLLRPWKQAGYDALGIDIDPQSNADYIADFFNFRLDLDPEPNLILCNPPFSGNKSKLLPEIWFDKIIELFGKEVPIVFFAPIGFRLNSTLASKRYFKFIDGTYPKITSQISLTRDIYNLEPNNRKTEFHSEILIFNIPNLAPHYFYQPPIVLTKS